MSRELMEALDILEKEKNISKESLFGAIENSLLTACRNSFGKADNVSVEMDRETCDFHVYANKTVVATKEEVLDPRIPVGCGDRRYREGGAGFQKLRQDCNAKCQECDFAKDQRRRAFCCMQRIF